MKKLFLLIFLCYANSSFAQNNGSKHGGAQKAYDEAGKSIAYKSYDKAIEQLKQAVSLDNKFTAAYQQLGDIYRRTKNYQESKSYYHKVLNLEPEFHSLTYFGLAESELNTGEYENALNHLKKYSSYPNLTDANKKLATKFIKDAEFSIMSIKTPVSFKPENLGESINTRAMEYLPAVTADEEVLIYTRMANKNEDFFKSIKNKDTWNKSEFLSPIINTRDNEGAQCISPDGMYLFFTGCNRPDGMGSCDIYISRREGKEWSKPFNIGAPVNSQGWESQPSLSADGRTLYFVSTRKGGMGGYDIWKSDLKEEGEWSTPVNLGASVNTSYDEQSPFIHPDDQTLYFSSNGWPGLGNKDIFIIRKNDAGGWQNPVNLGYPINTFGEESSLTISSNGKTAFFAADRKGGFGGMDIYSFELPEKLRPKMVTYVKGQVFDKETNEVLDGKIQIINLANGKVVYDDVADLETGEFLATMPIGNMYALNVSKEGFLFYSENFSLKSVKNNIPYLIKVPLQKIAIGKMVTLKNIFFETNKFDLLPESKAELQQLVSFLQQNLKVTIEISGHTDNIGDAQLNTVLSDNRAKVVYNYLISNKIIPSRLTYKGYGKGQPVANNNSEEGRQTNRRTEFKVTKN
ncbi:MAG TPA: OmpA family protein [Sphingobacteriaceae bacterium]|nr:OmpA family protein [Sphingobacteriaceae bacterium]